jgi:hypothetical protein
MCQRSENRGCRSLTADRSLPTLRQQLNGKVLHGDMLVQSVQAKLEDSAGLAMLEAPADICLHNANCG